MARFLEKLGLEPIILHEKPNAGRTVIEKFSDYADVHFAVVLLTADDEGRARGTTGNLTPRARQQCQSLSLVCSWQVRRAGSVPCMRPRWRIPSD